MHACIESTPVIVNFTVFQCRCYMTYIKQSLDVTHKHCYICFPVAGHNEENVVKYVSLLIWHVCHLLHLHKVSQKKTRVRGKCFKVVVKQSHM